jgi:hypothetical protein
VLAGSYTIEVKAPGFRPLTKSGIEVVVGAVRREDIEVQVGQTNEAITVVGGVVSLQTEKVDVSSEINSKAVNNLPIGGYRNYQSLINLVPGATPGAYQNAAISRPGRALTTNINGTNRNNNVTKLDGAVNISTWLPHHVAYVAPAETIETVNVSTNNFDAEQGMAGGAAVTVVTKSGTNDLHGSLFGFHDNQHLRAWGFFESRTPNSRKVSGTSMDSPSAAPSRRTSSSSSAAMSRTGAGEPLWPVHVPTADQREGDFSAYSNTIYDPATGTIDGKGRTPFAGNVIPLARQSAISRRSRA